MAPRSRAETIRMEFVVPFKGGYAMMGLNHDGSGVRQAFQGLALDPHPC